MSLEFLNAGLHAADEIFNQLDKTFEREAAIQTDAMFERMWAAKKAAEKSRESTHTEAEVHSFKYTSRDYERYGFRSRAKMESFVTEMQKRGADVAFATVEINGQWLVELHKVNEVPVQVPEPVANDDADDDSDDETAQNQPPATETLTAAQLVEEYRLQTFEEVERQYSYKDDEWLARNDNAEAGSTAQAEMSAMKNFMARNMEFLGTAIVKADNATKTVERFGNKYGTKARIQNESFGRKLKTVTDEETGETRQVADRVHRLNGGTGRMKKAVIVGDTVIIDGKVITDSAVRQKVLQQREIRINAAKREIERVDKAKPKTEIHFDAHNARDNIAANTQAAVQSMKTIAREDAKYVFKSSLIGATAVASAATGVGLGVASAATLSASALGAGVLASSAGAASAKTLTGRIFSQEERENHERVKEKLNEIEQGRKDAQKNVWSLEKNAEDITTRRANAEQALKNDAPMEVVSGETVSRAFRKGGLLDEYTNALNTQALVMAYHTEHGIGIIERTLEKTKTEGMSDSVFYERMKTLVKNPEAAVRIDGVAAGTKMPDHIQESINDVVKRVEGGELSRKEAGEALRTSLSESVKAEREMLAGATLITIGDKTVRATDVANDLQKKFGDLGIDFKGGKLTREDLVKVNIEIINRSRTANINIVDRHGNIDVKILKSLNDTQKKMLGLDGVGGEMLMKLNEKGAWGNFDWNELSFIGSGFSKLATKATGDDEDTAKMVQGANQTVNYSKKTVATVKRFHASEKKRMDAKRAKKSGKDGKEGKEGKAGKEGKDSKKLKEFDEKRAEKGVSTQKDKLAKTNKSENNAFAKARQKKDKIAGKIANNPVIKALNKLKAALAKLLIKALMYVGIAVVALAFILALVFIVIMIINSLFNFDWTQPTGYTDTVAYQLMEKTDDHEDQWRDEVENSVNLFDMIGNMTFTNQGLTAEEHLNNLGATLNYDMGVPKVYLSPFGNLTEYNGVNSEYMTELTGINGATTYSYSANVNNYGLKNSTGVDYCTTESGHTDNSKDIVVMADIMFKNNMDEYSDSMMTETMGMSMRGLWVESAKLFLKAAWHNVTEWWEDVKAGWKNFWGIGSEDEQNYEPKYVKVGEDIYSILESYTIDLFNQSHQQIYTAHVEYHTPDEIKKLLDDDGNPVNLEAHEAAALGYCYSPVTNAFPLMLTSAGTVAPYLEDSAGKHRLDVASYDVTLSLYNGTYVDNDACLTTTMAANADTFNWIKNHMNTAGYADCWTLNEGDRVKVNGDPVTTGWYDNQGDAEEAARNALATKHNNFTVASEDSYVWNADTVFIHNYNQKYNYSNSEIDYDVETREVPEWRYGYWTDQDDEGNGYGSITCYPSEEQKGYGMVWQYYFVPESAKVEISQSSSGDYGDHNWRYTENADGTMYRDANGVAYFQYKDNKGLFKLLGWLNSYGVRFVYYDDAGSQWDWSFNTDENGDTIESGSLWCVPYGATYDKTQYKVTATAPFYTKNTDNYIRNCQKHDFTYCGGHLGLHCQGITYSVTNEQLYLSGAYDTETQYPVVLDADLEAMGYSPLIGKVIRKEVDYENTAEEASLTGGCANADTHIQGSVVADRGLNLYVIDEEWVVKDSSGNSISVRSIPSIFNLRDIFDADCLIDKGATIFPIIKENGYRDYEGWTADNMTLTGVKMTTNWYDLYEFDIPYELDGKPISQKDINAIVENLKGSYGSQFTEQREAVVRTALDWVGRFHYSESHTDHNLLSELCTADGASGKYDASCTAGDDEAFVRFVLERSGKLNNSMSGMYYAPASGVSLLPADVLKHNAGGSLDDFNISSLDVNIDKKLKAYTDESYVIYLGELSSDLTIGMGDHKRTIYAGATLSIDLNNYDNAGTVQLRIKDAESNATLDFVNSDSTYYWVVQAANGSPDDRTRVYTID